MVSIYGGLKKPKRKVYRQALPFGTGSAVARSTNFNNSKGFDSIDQGFEMSGSKAANKRNTEYPIRDNSLPAVNQSQVLAVSNRLQNSDRA